MYVFYHFRFLQDLRVPACEMLCFCRLKQYFHANTWQDFSVHYFCIQWNEKHGSHIEKIVKTNLSNFIADRSGHVEDRALKFGLFAIVSTSVDDLGFFSSLFNLFRTLIYFVWGFVVYMSLLFKKHYLGLSGPVRSLRLNPDHFYSKNVLDGLVYPCLTVTTNAVVCSFCV